MINLGLWQLRRLDERRAFNATVEARYDAPPVPLGSLLPDGDAPEDLVGIEWRPVTARGVFDPAGEIKIVNRSQHGVAGSFSVTPLELDDGRVLLVNRGFVPLAMDPSPPAPTTPVSVLGRLRLSQPRRFGGLSDPATGPLDVAQRVDIDRLREQQDGPVVPMYLELAESTPATAIDGVPDPVLPPDLSEGSHLSYAVQWFLFSIAVAVGWVLAVRHSIAARRDRLAADRSPDHDSVRDDSDPPTTHAEHDREPSSATAEPG